MPVSRKRKSKKAAKQRDHRGKQARELRDHVAVTERNQRRRIGLVRPSAAALVAELTTLAESKHGAELEDELCARLGPILSEWDRQPVGRYAGADHFAVALLDAAGAAVTQTLQAGEEGTAGWRVLDASVQIMPSELLEQADALLPDLENLLSAPERPAEPEPPSLAGQPRWTRDRYGSRFAVTAPFATSSGRSRWYLWDIDACAFQPNAVFSGYFRSPEAALDVWRDNVGSTAAGDAEWAEIDDAVLLRTLLPVEVGNMAIGGESAGQFAEYYRTRRLAEELLDPALKLPALAERPAPPGPSEFAAWQRDRAGAARPEGLDDMAEALAEMWAGVTPSLFLCCSPHRVAYVALSLRDEFDPEYAGEVLKLLPDWVTWIAERSGLDADLTARALAYASGGTHPDLGGSPRDMPTQPIVVE